MSDLTWKRGRFAQRCWPPLNRAEVEGWVSGCGRFGIAVHTGEPWYSLTHLHCGFALGAHRDPEVLLSMAELFAAHVGNSSDWRTVRAEGERARPSFPWWTPHSDPDAAVHTWPGEGR